MGRVRSRKRRVRDDDFIVGCGRMWSDVVGLSSNRLSLGGSIQGVSAEILSFKIAWQAQYLVRLEGDFTCSTHWKWSLMTFILRGRRSIWWGWRVTLLAPRIGNDVWKWRRSLMTFILRGRRSIWWGRRVTLVAPRIGNDVSYVTQIIDDIDFVWQAQYLVRLAGDFSWQAQHFVTFWKIAGTRNVVFYNTKASPKMGRVRSRKRRVRNDDFIVGCGRMWSDYRRIVFLLAEAFREFPLKS